MKFKSLLLFSLLSQSVHAAQDTVEINPPSFAHACNAENTVFDISPDGQAMTILFSDFFASASGETEASKNCKIAVPFQLPPKFTISSFKIGFAGYTRVAKVGRANLKSEVTIDSNSQPARMSINKNFRSNSNEDFVVEKNVTSASFPCGGNGLLTLDNTLYAKSNLVDDETVIGLDSKDLENKITFEFKLMRCN